MRNATRGFIILSLSLALSACRFQSVRHSQFKAATDANQFLKALYVDEDCARALQLAAIRSVTAEDLKKMVDQIKQERGSLKKLRADSYLMTPGQTMELFYIGEYEKGALYHRLVLIGDSSGYKVTGVWFKSDPYPEHSLRRKFDGGILVE